MGKTQSGRRHAGQTRRSDFKLREEKKRSREIARGEARSLKVKILLEATCFWSFGCNFFTPSALKTLSGAIVIIIMIMMMLLE